MSNYKHGHGSQGPTRSREYKTWRCMRTRCAAMTGPSKTQYRDKGIKCCPEWDDFTVFYENMGKQPPGMTLDRIDNSKGYSKENCRWATTGDQSRHRATIRWFTINGETKCLKDWAREFRMPYKLVHSRVRHGWPLGMALTIAIGSTKLRRPN